MSLHDIRLFMSQMTHEISSEYARLQARAGEDPGTAGSQGEETWAQLLRRWVPSGYHVVTGGRVIDTDGNTSPQVDVLILHPSYPPGLLEIKHYLASAVIAAFECKLTLTRAHITFQPCLQSASGPVGLRRGVHQATRSVHRCSMRR